MQELLAERMYDQEIAKALSISFDTVEFHRLPPGTVERDEGIRVEFAFLG